MSSDQKRSWREAFQELKAFAMRDLQDYRFADYYQLCRKSRYLLLSVFMLFLLCAILFLWRSVIADNWLSEVKIQRAQLERQIGDISDQNAEYQQFLANEASILIAKNSAHSQDNADIPDKFTETEIIELVESLALAHQLAIITQLPKREIMMIEHLLPEKRGNSGHRIDRIYQGNRNKHSLPSRAFIPLMTPIIPQLIPLPEALKVSALHSLNQAREEVLFIPQLEISYSLSGDFAEIWLFLANLQEKIAGRVILYLKELTIQEQHKSSLKPSYQLTLQFYDPELIHQAYLSLGNVFPDSDPSDNLNVLPNTFFPQTLGEITAYLASFIDHQIDNKTDNYSAFIPSEVLQEAIVSLFREAIAQDYLETDSNLLTHVAHDREALKVWRMGEKYQGMLLAGIVDRTAGTFVIVKMPTGKWQILREGDFNILEITATQVVVGD